MGAGRVGFSTAQILVQENHDVVVIDSDEERIEIVQDNLDVQVILGNGASAEVLQEAGIKGVDLFVATTESDERNIVACLVAKDLGAKSTVARVRNPEYTHQGEEEFSFGVDLIINPERVAAMEIAKLVRFPGAQKVEYYAGGKIQLLALKIEKNCPVINQKLVDLDSDNFLVVAILRDNEPLIPRGDDLILEKDTIFVVGKSAHMDKIMSYLGFARNNVETVSVLGGGRVGYYLARELEDRRISVKIIEKDYKKCKELAEKLNDSLILNADGTDIDLLKEEEIAKSDVFVAVSSDDKLNLLVSLLVKHLGVKKTITQIRHAEYIPLVEKVGLDTIVSPRSLTASAILKFIYPLDIVSVTLFGEARAEVLEIIVPETAKGINKPLKDIKFPRGAIIGGIERDKEVIVPTGNDHLEPGDTVVVFAIPEAIIKVEAFFGIK